ncbi:MAG: glycosyltransferase family protein [Elusimicrobia bacterium]|nr:glycosyltransferase family protein [Elusimicrobiota bacterium]
MPGKVLLSLGGKKVLEHVVGRIRRARLVRDVVVATTIQEEDLEIVRFCAENKIRVYVGSEQDVLDRYYQAARLFHVDHVVRITADCPVIDPRIINRVIARHLASRSDLTANILRETFPDGQDVEVFTFSALSRAWKEAKLASQREHVTPYLKDHPTLFKLTNVACRENLGKMRWTLDNKEDFLFLKHIFNALYDKKKIFGMEDILRYLRTHPEVEKINGLLERNEGYKKSLRQDRPVGTEWR